MVRAGRIAFLSCAAVAAISFGSLLAAAASPSFEGEYRATTKLSDDAYQDSILTIGPTVNGRAAIEGIFPQGAHACAVEGKAKVHEGGLTYREETGKPEGPFVLEIEIGRGEATVEQVSGPPTWLCGANGMWNVVSLLTNATERNRKSYDRAVACYALYEFLAGRERAQRGETQRFRTLDDLTTISGLYVVQFADASRIGIPEQERDEAAMRARLEERRKNGTLGASALRTEEAACDRAAHDFFATPDW